MKVKKKVKIKKKNFMILILIIMSISTLTYTGMNFFYSNQNDKTYKKIIKDKRLEELGNIDEKLNYFNKDYIDRYLKYKENNPNLSNKEIVLNVNIGLDNPFYTNTKEATDLYENTILVNKYNYLNADYEPKDLEEVNTYYARNGMKLVKEAKEQYEAMAKAAENANLKLVISSSYRSYQYQENLYNNYVIQDGEEIANTYSAKPGFSEHQTGLAIDLSNGKTSYTDFENTKEFKWMQENAYKYGFILRFPEDKVNVTGYQYEPWHYRYLGIKIASYIHENKISYEEYYAMFLEN